MRIPRTARSRLLANGAQPPSNVAATSESWWADPKQWKGKTWQEIAAQMRTAQRGITSDLLRNVRTPEAERMTGYKSSQRYLKIQRGQHPAPVPLSTDGRAVGYPLVELIALNLSLLAAQLDAKPHSRSRIGAAK